MVTLRDAEALVGLRYVPGRFDCMHLAVLAQHQLFGHTVRWADQRHPVRDSDQVLLLDMSRAEVCRRLAVDEALASGHAVLFTVADGAAPRYHIGTLILGLGERWVLHTSQALGSSVLQRLSDCAAAGLRVEGFYAWL